MGTDLNIGHVTAYAYAKSKGYTGTEEQFATELAQFAQNAQKVAEDKAAVEQLVDEFLNTTAPAVIQDVTDEGTSQVERVADAGTAQVTRVGRAGDTQIDAVASAGTTQIGLVTAEGTAQVTRVQDKGDEVIDSIPADYTALTQEVSDLNQQISGIYDNYQIIMFDTVANEYPSSTGFNPYNNWTRSDYIPVTPGETVFINSPTRYSSDNAFYDADKVFKSTFTIGQQTPAAVIVPDGAYYMVISNQTSAFFTEVYRVLPAITASAKYGNYGIWESGSITPSNGQNNQDTTSIRFVDRFYFDNDVKVVFLKNTYRVRFFIYNVNGTYSGSSDWIYPNDLANNPYSIDRNKRYRVQISTYNISGTINKDDALNSVKFYSEQSTLSFWDTYITNKANMINSYLANGNDKSVFLFLTDTHWNNSPEYLNHYGINPELMRFLSKKCNINIVIHGGDLNSENRSDKYIAITNMTDPVAKMRSAFENVFLTRGNHDDNIEGANNVWDYVITQSDSYSYMFRGTKNVVFGETGTYFYHDIPHEKLRVISLDCIDFPYSNSVDASKSDLKILAYGYTQLQWLCDTLKNTPDGYHIVIYTHAMLAPSIVTVEHPTTSPQTRALNYLTVCDLIKAYKTRANFTASMDGSFVSVHQDYYTGNLNGDFTNCNASIVGVFSGHEHVDCIEEILDSNGNGIGIYNTCTQNSSALFSSDIISSTYQHPMEIGTTTELVWDVVVIDRASKAVRMIRIGANGANADVDEVNVRAFNY